MDKFYSIQNIEELYLAVTRRKHWNRVRPELIQRILANTDGNIDRFKEFVMVSERHDCVRRNFLELQRLHPSPLDALSSFSLTMLRLGSETFQTINKLPEDSERQRQAITLAGISYWSAIICDPMQLTAYSCLGWLYAMMGAHYRAIEMCQMYDKAEQELRTTEESELSGQNIIRKNPTELADMRNLHNYLRKELGLPHEDLIPLTHKGFCPQCGKNVEPTFHGTCPECGTFLMDM